MTTGVPSGRRASALSVRSVAWRQPALAGVPIVSPRARRPVHREPVAAVPPGRKSRLVPRDDDDAAAEAPARARDLVGDVEPAARRGRVARPDRHPPTEDDAAVLAQRQEPLRRDPPRRRSAPSAAALPRSPAPSRPTPFSSTSLSTANQLPRRSTTRRRLTEPNGVFQPATASVRPAGARRIATLAPWSITSVSARPGSAAARAGADRSVTHAALATSARSTMPEVRAVPATRSGPSVQPE